MTSTTPRWRQMFDAWEKAANPLLTQAASSPQFREITRVGAQVNKTMWTEMERSTAQWLHLWNLPAGSDVRRLRTQVRDMEKELRSIRRSLETLAEDRTDRELDDLLSGRLLADIDDAMEKLATNGDKPKKSKNKK